MDFSQFDSRTAAETARPLHLRHPATGAPLYADAEWKQPCEVLVLGTEGRSAQAAMRAAQKAKLTGEKADDDRQTMEDVHAGLVATAKPLITGFRNISRGEMAATLADVEWFLNLNLITGRAGETSFVEQVMNFATSRANYLGNGSPV
ncbi:hypothetical protein DWF04_015805 [Cereibacter sphaeroides f. sp. denitrificans]|nr:hypothetical protein DWF04_16120 [Cereibacter sphaeroides f. sp. denitrificans]